jgi:uroporphyrinogen decarboxylase
MVRLWRDRDYPVCLMGNGTMGLYSQLRSWVGTEGISYMFYDDPALVAEMLEFHTEFFLQLIERALGDMPFDYFNFFEDCAGKGGPLFGPELFRKFFMKPYQRIIARLNRAGIKSIWVDSDGDAEALVPLWMEAGVNCFWPLEQASGMDPLRLRKKFGKSLILCGGLDKMEIAKGPKAIERELTKKIPPLMEQGGYIPHIDHAISPEISYANFLYYLDLKRKLIGRG